MIAALTRGPAEPSYRGKRLSDWLDDTRATPEGPVVLSDASVGAVRAIGEGAIPFLLEWLCSSDSEVEWRLGQLLNRQSAVTFATAAVERDRAMRGFRALGLDAKPVFPELVELVLHHPDEDVRGAAINALIPADDETFAEIARAIEDPDPSVRRHAADALISTPEYPGVTVPALVQALSDQESEVRANAVRSLRFFHRHRCRCCAASEAAVPKLTALAQDADPSTRHAAADLLQLIESRSCAEQN